MWRLCEKRSLPPPPPACVEQSPEDLEACSTLDPLASSVTSSDEAAVSTATGASIELSALANTDSAPPSLQKVPSQHRVGLVAIFIFLVGAVACTAILATNIPRLQAEQTKSFRIVSSDLLQRFDRAVQNYLNAGLWLHQACRDRRSTHEEFRIVYEYLLSTQLEFQAVSFAMNVTNETYRLELENATRTFVEAKYPNITYRGFMGFEPNPATGQVAPMPRSIAPFYFPVHFVEPLEDVKNVAALDFDIFTSPSRRKGIEEALATGKPAVSERLKLIQETQVGTEPYAYSVILFHPGANFSVPSPDVSVLAIRIPELLVQANEEFHREEGVTLYMYDSSDPTTPYLGGAVLHACAKTTQTGRFNFTDEISLEEVRRRPSRFQSEYTIPLASRNWTFVIVAEEGSFEPDVFFVIFGALMIFVTSTAVAVWVWSMSRRLAKMNDLRALAEKEKAEIRIENAKKAAKNERELNDFIAHEVRNPLSAAISACSFVSTSINETEPLVDSETRQSVRDDVQIIDNSLQFINDLLRNMLDMHRASSNQLTIETEHVDLMGDVLQPVASLIYHRGDNFEVQLECPQHTVILSDRLRLKQVILNLGRNAAKFVHKGFVRLRVDTGDNQVKIYVEDSGPGIPVDKREQLFRKFQESLDSLNQGTGIGLCLCKNLVELMGGRIWLDESYDSGIENCPGSRFVVELNTPPIQLETLTLTDGSPNSGPEKEDSEVLPDLPSELSVLFVDDAFVLRKLFGRAVRRIAPSWTVEEAASGETALRIVDTQEFDLIFVDQYMASADKQLLGTETVRALRGKGVTAIICGLSANDLEKPFTNAGADTFSIKPFPCEANELTRELLRILKVKDV